MTAIGSLLKRGFKSDANAIAREVRTELGLLLAAPLNPWTLAQHLEIPVFALRGLRRECPDAYRHFVEIDPASFSAVTVFKGTQRVIVHNDAHSEGRQGSNLAHELAHGLLLHPPMAPLDSTGCRNWDSVVEEEADWLAGALLISDEAAIQIVRDAVSESEAQHIYGVSGQMLRFRLNVTGARLRVSRARSLLGRS